MAKPAIPPASPTTDHRAGRSDEAVIYRAWYGTQRWKRRRKGQLRAEPFCVMCRKAGVYTAATVADHVTPHKGDPLAFWTGRLQSLLQSPTMTADKTARGDDGRAAGG